MAWNKRSPAVVVLTLVHTLVGCGSSSDSPDTPTSHPDANTFVEKTLSLDLFVATPDASTGAADKPAPAETLSITALDGATPVITDLWLYTLDATAGVIPLSGFTSTASRKSPNLMLPATIGGAPSGLSPADDGSANGVMTNATRGTWKDGALVATVTGTVVVSLPTAVTQPIVVVAGVEDQRYAGVAAINPDGTSLTPPKGIGQPERHTRRSFEREVQPLLIEHCFSCHRVGGPDDANLYLVTGSAGELVNDNFALKEDTEDCEAENAAGSPELAACIQAIDKAEFLVEPGAPALSDLLTRSRPDENGGTSDTGLLWYGGGNPKSRFNATYGDRRMPSTTQSTDPADWQDAPTEFDLAPADFQVLYDWVAQGADQSAPK